MPQSWIAKRTSAFQSSGIRRVFDLAAKLENPVNLSIGQPDFDVPETVRQACCEAIQSGRNGYSQTQGIAPLRQRIQAEIDTKFQHQDRQVFISSGTSGGLTLAMLALVDPGDEVIYFDPYFVMYPSLIALAGGIPVPVSCYPDFQIDPDHLAAAITPKTKMIILNSPSNPTGIVASDSALQAVAELAEKHNIALVSDEIYSAFQYDTPFVSPASFNDRTIVIDGFSKSHAMTGWRVGFVHGPSKVIENMTKIQQYTFVCSPQPAQWAGLQAMDIELSMYRNEYREKRDLIVAGLSDLFEITIPGGAFYIFPKSPDGMTGTQFVEKAIAKGLLIIPGAVFSGQDTHFRISYAASNDTLKRGIDILRSLVS